MRWLALMFSLALNASADTLDAAHPPVPSPLPDAGASLLRVSGAFLLVVGLFLAGVWLFRNWRRVALQRNGGSKLTLIEVKSLGQRQALYVVGYQKQRMLLASSPSGVTLVSHLPAAGDDENTGPSANLNFTEALQHVLSRR